MFTADQIAIAKGTRGGAKQLCFSKLGRSQLINAFERLDQQAILDYSILAEAENGKIVKAWKEAVDKQKRQRALALAPPPPIAAIRDQLANDRELVVAAPPGLSLAIPCRSPAGVGPLTICRTFGFIVIASRIPPAQR